MESKLKKSIGVISNYVSKTLVNDRNFVEPDTVEEWADFIHDELSGKKLLMM